MSHHSSESTRTTKRVQSTAQIRQGGCGNLAGERKRRARSRNIICATSSAMEMKPRATEWTSPSADHLRIFQEMDVIEMERLRLCPIDAPQDGEPVAIPAGAFRSEEHTSELQSLMRISYAVFCLKKKTKATGKKKKHTNMTNKTRLLTSI